MMHTRIYIAAAGLNGFVATGLAALGTHAFKLDTSGAELFAQASEFHFIHTLALIGCAALNHWGSHRWGARSAVFFLVGILAFSGSLYYRAILGPGSLGGFHWLTPLGGLSLMIGWLSFAYGGYKLRRHTHMQTEHKPD